MQLLEVVVDIPTKSIDEAFIYGMPEGEGVPSFEPEVGCAVEVPFGARHVIGFIVRIFDGAPPPKLKHAVKVVSKSYFDELGAQCARFLSKRYIAPLSVCIRMFTPPGGIPKIAKVGDVWQVRMPQIGQVDDRWVVLGENAEGYVPRKSAAKQIVVLDAVKEGDIKVSELNALYGNVSSAIGALEKKGVVRVEKRRRIRGALSSDQASGLACGELAHGDDGDVKRDGLDRCDDGDERAYCDERDGTVIQSDRTDAAKVIYRVQEFPMELTESQCQAIDIIEHAYDAQKGEVVLIDGVTGSGKTEVYLRVISRALEGGKSAIVLVPEISLTPQTVARFRGRFGDTVAVLHSKMSAGERYDQWDMIRAGAARVVVGPRSALFCPLQNVGLIVIDEEHESTYKQESAPRYVARDVAEWMMRARGGTLVLGSATPSIESLYRAHVRKSWHVAEMPERANGRQMPPIEIIDMTKESRAHSNEIFSKRLKRAIVEELHAGNKVVLLLNQRGFSQYLLCRDCGFVPKCISCSTTLTYHAKINSLVCHHCGYTVKTPSRCPECESVYLQKQGIGTERVEDELRALLDAEFGELPEIVGIDGGRGGELDEAAHDIEVVRMDSDTTSKKGAHQKLLERFAQSPRAILLGTQMIAKGLDFEEVTLVGVINIDMQLHLPDFRASERAFDLIEQVAGRAGRGELAGRVMVQTHDASDRAIVAAANYDRDAFLRSEIPKRRVLRYPPFVRMANALVWGRNASSVKEAARLLQKTASSRKDALNLEDWDVLAATACVFEKIRNDWRWHFVVKCPNGKDISAFMHDVWRSIKLPKDVNVAFDIDPYDML